MLTLRTNTCLIDFTVQDRTRIPYEDLVRVVESAQFGDCTNSAAWTNPLPG